VTSPTDIHIVQPTDVPNPNWLVPGIPSAGQQRFGDHLLAAHKFVLLPSVVSRHSWNLVFDASTAAYTQRDQEQFALDPRLHRPTA
jgi:RES domain-containing protein